MYNLEHDGYRNVTALKRSFAIEVDDYDEKEAMLHTIFEKCRVSGIISIVRTLVFNLATIIVVPIVFFYVFGSSYEAAFYGVWYSVVFSELFAMIMTFGFFKKYGQKYQFA